jgi:hypothetical protein
MPPIDPVTKTRKKTGRESFKSLEEEYEVPALEILRYNFPDLVAAPSKKLAAYVNWYLRHNLGCHEATQNGENYLFSGGEVIYVPVCNVVMDEEKVVAAARERRLLRFAYHETKIVEPRDPEGPNPLVMLLSDLIKDWITGKATGKKAL